MMVPPFSLMLVLAHSWVVMHLVSQNKHSDLLVLQSLAPITVYVEMPVLCGTCVLYQFPPNCNIPASREIY